MRCAEVRKLLSSYLDGAVTGRQMAQTDEHLRGCDRCQREYELLNLTQRAVAGLGRKPAPANLDLQLRIALSREAIKARQRSWDGLKVRWQNALNAFMFPATAGVFSAVIFFGLLIGFFALPQPLQASGGDVPSWLYTPPQLRFSPFEVEMRGANSDSIVVEAYIDTKGRVQDYKILSAPKDIGNYRPMLNNMLIFSVFRPATAFGQPTIGKTLLSFSKINVKG